LCVAGKACVHRAVSVITDIVDSLGSEGVSRSKQLCYACLSGYIDSASQLIAVYIQHSGQSLHRSDTRLCLTSVNACSIVTVHVAHCRVMRCSNSLARVLTVGGLV